MQLKSTNEIIRFKALKLDNKFKHLFRKPYGITLKGSYENVTQQLMSFIRDFHPIKFISVGDVVLEELIKYNLIPNIAIIDFKVNRKKYEYKIDTSIFQRVFKVENPPGYITCEAWLTIQYAIALNQKSLIIVDGEEDLLALPAVLCAPVDSIIVFGLPGEGVLLVPVNSMSKSEAFKLLSFLEPYIE